MHGDLSVARYRLLVTLLGSILVGCSAPSEALIEYRACKAQETLQTYRVCRELYATKGVTWVQDSKGYVPKDRRDGYPRYPLDQQWEIKMNGCPYKLETACGPKPK